MTSIGDKLALQLPLTSATQSLEQIAGDAAINVAKAIGSSNAPPSTDETSTLPSAGIAAQQTAPSTGQASPSSTDFTTQRGPSDALLGTRSPTSDVQALSLSGILQTAQLLTSVNFAAALDNGTTGPDQAAGSQADDSSTSAAPGGSQPTAVSAAGTSSPQATAALAAALPTPAGAASALDQKSNAVGDQPTANTTESAAISTPRSESNFSRDLTSAAPANSVDSAVTAGPGPTTAASATDTTSTATTPVGIASSDPAPAATTISTTPASTAGPETESSRSPSQTPVAKPQSAMSTDALAVATGSIVDQPTDPANTQSSQPLNPRLTETVDARLDGSVIATKIVNDRPDAPQMISGGVTSNVLAAAIDQSIANPDLRSTTSDETHPSNAADVVTWQVARADTDTSFAAIDVGAKQSSTWSDARDQSQQTAQMVDELTRPAAESNGLDAPRPQQSITTGALIGAVLSAPETSAPRLEPGFPLVDQLNPAAGDLRTGITASGILNAAMIPGWPQQPLAGKSHVETALAQKAANPGMSDEEILTYLTNLGADEAMLAKVRKALEKPVAGRKIAFYLASLATALSVIFKSLAGELETIMDEDAETADARRRADTRGKKSRRDRLYLE